MASCVALPVTRAQDSVTSVTLSNNSGYIIASDAGNATAGYDRDALHVNIAVQYSGLTLLNSLYQLHLRLLDSRGQAQTILDRQGKPAAEFVTNITVAPHPAGSISGVYRYDLKPVSRLDSAEQFRVEAQLWKSTILIPEQAVYTPTGASGVSPLGDLYHFPSTVSDDAALNVLASLEDASYTKTYLLNTDPSIDDIRVNTRFILRRYDGFSGSRSTNTVQVRLVYELHDLTNPNVAIPLRTDNTTVPVAIENYNIENGIRVPVLKTNETQLRIRLAEGEQLDPVNKTYQVRVTVTHEENPGPPAIFLTGNRISMLGQRFLHFNGVLLFGEIATTFDYISNQPAVSSLTPGEFVSTQLRVDRSSGYVTTHPLHTYGNGAVLNVRLRPSGEAELASGTVTLDAPRPDLDETGRVRFERSGVLTFTTNGLTASVRAWLPTGFGYGFDRQSRILKGIIEFGPVELNSNLAPAKDLKWSSAPLFCEESKPVWIEADAITWRVAAGNFRIDATGARYVREDELRRLAAAPDLASPDMKSKPSNDGYFRYLDPVQRQAITLRPNAQGHAEISAELAFTPGAFDAHFPYKSHVAWQGTGQLTLTNDLVDAAKSFLLQPERLDLSYDRNCDGADCDANAGPAVLPFQPGEKWLFTRDGGLISTGMVVNGASLQWGAIPHAANAPALFAQQTTKFLSGSFYMPGCFLRGDQSAVESVLDAGVLLLTGAGPALERPATDGYFEGLADYAGLNFRSGRDGGAQASSVLAGVASDLYNLSTRSKYYVRQAGVSGIHEAAPNAFEQKLVLYGHPFTFRRYGLSYLESKNGEGTDSRTEGSLHVRNPSDFDLDFEKLKFTCVGGLESAELPGSTGEKLLRYWLADFTPESIDFRPDPADACNPAKGFLVLGVAAHAAHVQEPLYGFTIFEENGNLFTAAAGRRLEIDTRLHVPNRISLNGPGQERYAFSTVGGAYLNNWNDFKEGTGFMNLAGKIDVPFFSDLEAHMQTSASRTGTNAPIYMMGGWTENGDFFTSALFDPENRAYPPDVGLSVYRNDGGTGVDRYRVRARQNWLGMIDLNYPLAWSSSARSFQSPNPLETPLLLLRVQHQVKYLSAENLELVFGAQYDGLPQINLANLAFNAVNESTGVEAAFRRAVGDQVNQALAAGMRHLDVLLADRIQDLINPVLDALVDPVIDRLYDRLSAEYIRSQGPNWGPASRQIITDYVENLGAPIGNIKASLNAMVGDTTRVPGLRQQLDVRLGGAVAGVDASLTAGLLRAAGGGERRVANALVRELVQQLAPRYVRGLVDQTIDASLRQANGSLGQIAAGLQDARDALASLRGQLDTEFGEELRLKVFRQENALATVASGVRDDLIAYFNQYDYSAGSPFTEHSRDELKRLIRQKVNDRLAASPVIADIQVTLRQRLYDLNAALREGLDSGFQQINLALRNALAGALAGVDRQIDRFLGDLSDVVGAGQINGYAHVNGDAIRELRLDGRFQWKVPDALEFNGYLQISERDSQGSPGCQYGGDSVTEVTLGAHDVNVDWLGAELGFDVMTKFTLQKDGSGVSLRGMAGGFSQTRGKLGFESFQVKQMRAQAAFGLDENYIAGGAALQFQDYDLSGGMFFGRTCSLDPILLVDPDVGAVLADVSPSTQFTGVYGYGEGHIPIFGSSCAFKIAAGVGAGIFYFVEGPTYGGKLHADVSGEALCLISIHGDIDLIGAKRGSDYSFRGKGRLKGKVGYCPFCKRFRKTVTLHFHNGSWDVDY